MQSLRLVVLSAFLAFAVACGSSSSSPSQPSPTPAPTPAPTPTPGGSSSSVSIPGGASSLGNRAFAPDSINVSVGDTVTWTNNDTIEHTSTSDGNAWNSGVVSPGGRFSFTFQSAGAFNYHCTIHPDMVGTVVVH